MVTADAAGAAGGTGRREDVLDALAAVVDVLEDSKEQVAIAHARARQLREGRALGASYAELLTAAEGPLVLEVVTDLLEALFVAGSRLRRAEARALYAEGLSMDKISRLLRVSRQRVSALIRATAGGAPALDRGPRRSAGLALTGAEYRMIAEALPHIVWLASPEGVVEYVNRMATEYTGLPAEDFYGNGWLEQVHPDDRERVRTAWQEATRAERAYEMDYRIFGADGKARWHMCRSLPVRGPDRLVTKWIGTATDIDGQKRMEEKLRVAERAASEAFAQVEALHAGAPVSDATPAQGGSYALSRGRPLPQQP